MKLSEAIRAGATIRPQAFKSYFEKGCSCALGAAVEAVIEAELPEITRVEPFLNQHFPNIRTRTIKHPYQFGYLNIFDTVTDLNDNHRWTREAIANYLEAQEE